MVIILRHLTLENYGPFTKLDIDLGDITVFVGRNNTGKSTALEAVALLLSSINGFMLYAPKTSVAMLSRLSSRANYLINLRSNSNIAVISGDVIHQGVRRSVMVRVVRGINGLGDFRNDVMREVANSIVELAPRSQEILMDAFRRVQKERGGTGNVSEAFREFVDGVITVLNDYVNNLLADAVFLSTYVDGEPLNIALLPMSAVVIDDYVVGKLVRLGLSRGEARRLLDIQVSRVSEGRVIHISKKIDIKPVNVQHASLHSFLIDDLTPDKQSELIDLLRGEVRYFYDYRGGQVILNFDSGKVSVPYALMGDGFRALVRMLGLIVGGVDVAIIDEPETHLHPGFMEVITKYMVEPRFLDKVQFVMATQSLEFLDYLLNAAKERNMLNRIRLIRLYLLPDGDIDYEQLSGDEAYDERYKLRSDLRVPKCVLIVLCEGKHDYEFIRETFMTLFPNVRVREHFPDDKDILIRRVYEGILPSYVPVIVEGGKDVLDGNVKVFISKLRSISRSFIKVLILRDSDSNDVGAVFNELGHGIRNFLKNRNRFPKHEPQMACGQRIIVGSFTLYRCVLRYRDGEVYLQFNICGTIIGGLPF
ncbi:AAA family ATPase [Vulcanisaeta sp. JCM 14467]|uniref:AAA family ATPase n=1 Tax=Vulcanisaeta sp. JCM 14467 TaxID=1295370 RepID=UPI0006D037EC|nr:AAA family ATPase [Vulcanisaeta sp. JCM 14467]